MLDQVRRECLALVEPSREEDGRIDYELYQSTDDPSVFVFFENWLSREHVEEHLKMPHCLAFEQTTEGMLAPRRRSSSLIRSVSKELLMYSLNATGYIRSTLRERGTRRSRILKGSSRGSMRIVHGAER